MCTNPATERVTTWHIYYFQSSLSQDQSNESCSETSSKSDTKNSMTGSHAQKHKRMRACVWLVHTCAGAFDIIVKDFFILCSSGHAQHAGLRRRGVPYNQETLGGNTVTRYERLLSRKMFSHTWRGSAETVSDERRGKKKTNNFS